MDLIQKHKKAFLIGTVIYAALLFLIVWTVNLQQVNAWLGNVLIILRPILIGLVLAYICNPFFRLYERRLLVNVKPAGLRRGLSLLLAYLSLFAILGVLLWMILPQLINSIVGFVTNFDVNVESAIGDVNRFILWLNGILPASADGDGMIPLIQADGFKDGFAQLLKSLNLENVDLLKLLSPDLIGSVVELAGDLFLIFTDTLFGFFISLYLLATKEKRYAQIMRARRAFLSDETNKTISHFIGTVEKSFGSFFRGKLIDSAIIGVLTYVVISLFDIPYAILIAAIVAITDIIPIIGPFIGVIPSAIIIVLTDPPKVIPFLITILVVQQIDGNIIAPKILGEHTGVSSLCVIIAITTMGTLWGFVGMLLGVPLFATILELGSSFLDEKLKKKGLPSETEYYATDSLPTDETDTPKKSAWRKRRRDARSGSLTLEEKQQLNAYALAQKHRLFSENPDEVLDQFVTKKQETTECSEAEKKASVSDNKPLSDTTPETKGAKKS